MDRVTEPELMLDPEQARVYAAADFNEPHSHVIRRFEQSFAGWKGEGCVLDLGCGPGDIAIRFARAYPRCSVDGVDGSEAMLAEGHLRLEVSGVSDRVSLHQISLPSEKMPRRRYDAVISNSLLHHLHEPQVLWETVRRYADFRAPVFIIDLLRPDNLEAARVLCDRYMGNEPALLRRDFLNSLCAAFTLDELAEQLGRAGLSHLDVQAVSDRHVMIWGFVGADKDR